MGLEVFIGSPLSPLMVLHLNHFLIIFFFSSLLLSTHFSLFPTLIFGFLVTFLLFLKGNSFHIVNFRFTRYTFIHLKLASSYDLVMVGKELVFLLSVSSNGE